MIRHTARSLKSLTQLNKLLPVFLFLLFFGQASGQSYSFSGNIGKYPIYLQMTVTGSEVEGYYFYKTKLIDLPLIGTYKAGLVALNTIDQYGNSVDEPEIFKFKLPNKAMDGTWTKKGKSSPLKLMPLTTKEINNPKCSNFHLLKLAPVRNDLSKIKIGLFKLKEVDTIQIVNGIKLRYFREVNTGIELFRIDSGLISSKQKDANSYLEFLHICGFLESLSCSSYSTYGSDFGYSISNLSISADFINFSVFETFYCGGAHPDEDNYGVNYNLNTQERIYVSDFIIPVDEEKNSYEERIYNYLARTQPQYFKEIQSSEEYDVNTDCEYFKKELWTEDCDFVFTSEGLKLLPSFAHYMAPCLDPEWAVVPYSELKDLIKPEYYSKLIRLKP